MIMKNMKRELESFLLKRQELDTDIQYNIRLTFDIAQEAGMYLYPGKLEIISWNLTIEERKKFFSVLSKIT